MTHPILPTQKQFAEWDSEYFDGERQNFDIMMLKAFQAGADRQLEQVIEWLRVNLPCKENGLVGYVYGDGFVDIDSEGVISDLKKAMRPQEGNQ